MNEPEIPDEHLTALARRLGAQAAARVDVDRTAAAVLARLRHEPAARQPTWLALAAALVLLVGAGAVVREVAHRERAASGPAPVAVDVSDLSAHQLGEVLNGLDQADLNALDEEPAATLESGLEELTPAELRNLLHSLSS